MIGFVPTAEQKKKISRMWTELVDLISFFLKKMLDIVF